MILLWLLWDSSLKCFHLYSIWGLGSNHASQLGNMLTQNRDSNLSLINFPISNSSLYWSHKMFASVRRLEKVRFIVTEWVTLSSSKLLQNRIIGKGFLQATAFNTTLGKAFLFSSRSHPDRLEELLLAILSVRNVLGIKTVSKPRCYCQVVVMLTENRGHP